MKYEKLLERSINHKLLLSFLAFKETPLDALLFLQRISQNSFFYHTMEPPTHSKYNTINGYEFNGNQIHQLLSSI